MLIDHIAPTIGRHEASTVTPKLLDDFYLQLNTDGLASGDGREVADDVVADLRERALDQRV